MFLLGFVEGEGVLFFRDGIVVSFLVLFYRVVCWWFFRGGRCFVGSRRVLVWVLLGFI